MATKCLLIIGLLFAAPLAAAQTVGTTGTPVVAVQVEEDSATPTLEELMWVARPVVVFADTPNDPRLGQQIALLDERAGELEDRDVVVLVDATPEGGGPLREELRPRGFTLVLIDKDGSVVRRHPAPVSARELINQIDRLPSRRQETGSLRQ